MNIPEYHGTFGPQTLVENPETKKVTVPETRMSNAQACQDFAMRLIYADERRSKKRARVNGLVDGNPPYQFSKLKQAGRAEACNVNWGIARAYLEAGVGAFYDLFSEAPGYISVRTDVGEPEQREIWSNIISGEADRILKLDKTWDYNMQISQWEMVLHGYGPFMFEDAYGILPKAFHCGNLKLPEGAKSDPTYWDIGMVDALYWPPELYKFIADKDAATAAGWDVEYTRLVIARAMGYTQQRGINFDWEYWQSQLKNNSFWYTEDGNKVIRCCWIFWKEFDGKISQVLVPRFTDTNVPAQYMFQSIGKFDEWTEVIHPMYFDHGNAGFHHSVTGLGVKMYSAMEYENRLICNLCDKAFAPKILFKPTTTESAQKFQLAHFGDYAVLNANFDWNQTGVAGLMNDGLAMHETLQNLIQSNLSSYRQQVPPQKSGNPVTKFEKQLEAAMASALNKTQFNRYYFQLRALYGEIYRRMSNPNTTDDRAKEFQRRCLQQGVPREALTKIEWVDATRVVGQGSAFMRKQAIDSLFPIVAALPEDGRDNLINDKIAAEAGQSAVNRYNPKKLKPDMATDQQAEALQWVGTMKVGVPPVVTPSQNPVTYAATFLNAATQALNSLQQGANPADVLAFLNIAGPAIAVHLKRMANDPTRKQVFEELSKQWQQLAKVTDGLKRTLMTAAERNQENMQKGIAALNDEQLKTAQVRNDIALKTAKTQAQLKQSKEKHQMKMAQAAQDMALSDAETAASIHTNRIKAHAEAQAAKEKAAASNGSSE